MNVAPTCGWVMSRHGAAPLQGDAHGLFCAREGRWFATQDGVHRLRAEPLCRLGAAGIPTDRDALLPDYLREPDAVPRQR